jgi:RimJ/RimL family protein N-acetyltransferase
VVLVNNYEHGFKIAERAGCTYNPNGDQVISSVENGELMGGVIYSGYTKASIFTHIAGFKPNWLSRKLLGTLFYYPFGQLQCNKIFCSVKGSNTKGQDFVLRLGFQVVCRVPGVYPGVAFDADMVIFDMNRADCPWLKGAANLESKLDGTV